MFLMYPAILIKEEKMFSVKFPDFPEVKMVTSSDVNVVESASISLENHIATLMLSNQELPLPTPINNLKQEKDSILVIVRVNLPELKHNYVKKTLTIPEWVNDLAIKHNLNFSHILTNALLAKIFSISVEHDDRE